MKNTLIGRVVLVALLSFWSGGSAAVNILYLNAFLGRGSAFNTLPNGTGLFDTPFLPFPYTADCTYSLHGIGLSADCFSNHTPSGFPGSFPGNARAYFQNKLLTLADPSAAAPKTFTTSDSILTFDVLLSYKHDVASQASKEQAKYYHTDVNDLRLGWGFFAVTNTTTSPVNLCLGISANKVVAFVDGLSQTSSSDKKDGYDFTSMYELADYVPGTLVNVQIQINKSKQTGTYFINGTKKLVVNLAGPLPAPGMTVVDATSRTVPGASRINASTSGLDGWGFSWVPVDSGIHFASLGSANTRWTSGGLVDLGLDSIFHGLPTVIPSSFEYGPNPGERPASAYAFGTEYKTTLFGVAVYSQ